MKKEAIIYLISFAVLLFLILSLVMACAHSNPSPPPIPPNPPPIQPPTASENQTPEEPPPVNEAKNEEEWYPIGTFSGVRNDTIPPFRIYGSKWRVVWEIDAEHPEDAALDILIYFDIPSGLIWKTATFTGGASGNITYSADPGGNRDFLIKVIARNLRNWTITLEDSVSEAPPSPVLITYIRYKGTVYPPDQETCCCFERVEPDEYVVIKNLGESPVKMGGWVLKNISKHSISFTFPSHFIFEPGQIIRVYTDEYHSETGGFSFYYITGDIWSNDEPNIAVLYDAHGYEVSRRSYVVSAENE